MSFKKYIIIGIPLLFLIGGLCHFIYDFTSQNHFVGYFVPINESIWEHSKLSVFPLIFYYLFYIILNKKVNLDKLFTSLFIAIILSALLIFMIYYFYTEAFGVHLMFVDISILFIALLISMLISYHYFKYGYAYNYIIMGILILLICVFYFYVTYNPLNFPIFKVL